VELAIAGTIRFFCFGNKLGGNTSSSSFISRKTCENMLFRLFVVVLAAVTCNVACCYNHVLPHNHFPNSVALRLFARHRPPIDVPQYSNEVQAFIRAQTTDIRDHDAIRKQPKLSRVAWGKHFLPILDLLSTAKGTSLATEVDSLMNNMKAVCDNQSPDSEQTDIFMNSLMNVKQDVAAIQELTEERGEFSFNPEKSSDVSEE
jgi:hypothetical protein